MAEELGFTIELRGDVHVIVWTGDGCRPATEPEVEMWQALRAQLPSQGGEAVEVVAWLSPETVEAVIPGPGHQILVLEGRQIEPLMTVAQHQRILDSSVGSADHVGVVFTMEALAPGGGVKSHASLNRDLPAGTKLYTHPADQVADDLTMVKVSRELLEEIVELHRRRGVVLIIHVEQLAELLNGGQK